MEKGNGNGKIMLKNVRYAVRSLIRTPGYTITFILTLGLGIGMNTAIFSVVNEVLLAPLPYPDADRIMYVRHPAQGAGVPNLSFSFLEVDDLRTARTLDEFVEYGDWTFTVVGDQEPHRAVGGLVTANYFDVLGLLPQAGRVMGSQDDEDGAEPAMVLTYDYWTRVFGADESVIGQTVKLFAFSQPKTIRIVGVLRPGTHYTGTRKQDFFVNYATNDHYQSATIEDARNHRMTDVFARLAPGQSAEAAIAELSTLHASMMEAAPDAYPDRFGFGIAAARWQDELTKEARPTFLMLMGTVVLVLLLACANVANLTLTRLVRRERELAVRAGPSCRPTTSMETPSRSSMRAWLATCLVSGPTPSTGASRNRTSTALGGRGCESWALQQTRGSTVCLWRTRIRSTARPLSPLLGRAFL